ncbi:hypothetical protein QEZ47_27400 [Aminobacter anthyllidis]|uniref:hypothetical protein n=1 Tax=Aminobacter anthyllidis TaxID=1035067 RepID=UPI0024551419|nr:hypothetical protein [Aminobacter anthyllidis]MDH4989165.1 hypothetical protein [Aminobacter anthyllidis]
MIARRQHLDQAILEAFKIANDAGRLDVADHLLHALECLCGDLERRCLDEAYRIVCDESGDLQPKAGRKSGCRKRPN